MVIVDSLSDGILVTRSRTEAPEVDGELLCRWDAGGAKAPVGQFLDVTITGADEYDLIAELPEL